MDRSRKSVFGTGALRPVKVDMSLYTSRARSPLGRCGLTPSPTNVSKQATPGFGAGRERLGLTPVRLADLSSRDASAFFSAKKNPNQTLHKSPKTRRCLYQDQVRNNQPRSGKKSVAPSKPAVVRSLRKPAIRVAPEKSRIPKPANVRNSKPETRSKPVSPSQGSSALQRPGNSKKSMPANLPINVLKHSTLGLSQELANAFEKQQEILREQQNVLQEQRNTLQEIKSVKSLVEEQKSMLLEAKEVFSQIIQDQRSILEDQRSILEEQKKVLDEAKSLSDQEFSAIEKAIRKSSECNLDCSKENVSNISVSEAAYRQMRRSLRFLGTPTLTHSNKGTPIHTRSNKKFRTPQIRTPRTALSNKVRSQLHNLLDD